MDKEIERLRAYTASIPHESSEFKPGDLVRLDTGCLGMVWGIDPGEGTVYVCYIDVDGELCGPSFGYELTKVNTDG